MITYPFSEESEAKLKSTLSPSISIYPTEVGIDGWQRSYSLLTLATERLWSRARWYPVAIMCVITCYNPIEVQLVRAMYDMRQATALISNRWFLGLFNQSSDQSLEVIFARGYKTRVP